MHHTGRRATSREIGGVFKQVTVTPVSAHNGCDYLDGYSDLEGGKEERERKWWLEIASFGDTFRRMLRGTRIKII